MVNTIYKPIIDKFLVIFIDDSNIYSKNWKQHLQHLRTFFEITRKNHLRLNGKKCYFRKQKLDFLGFVVSREGTHADPKKVEKVQNFPQPKTPKEALSFMMLASYYRRFIKDFAVISAPIRELMKKGTKFEWNQEAQKAFQTLKDHLISVPILI